MPIPCEDLDPTLVETIPFQNNGLTLGDLKDGLQPQHAIETTPGGDAYMVPNANTYDFVGHSAAKTAFTLPHWI